MRCGNGGGPLFESTRPVSRDELLRQLRARCDDLARLGALVRPEAVYGELLAKLERFFAEEDQRMITLEEAAVVSGYSRDHLRRLHRLHRIPAERRGRRLYFRAANLPKKTSIDPAPSRGYDPLADARQVADRRAHGGES